jgi:hypothetical protein
MDYVIFNSPFSLIAFAVAAGLYLLTGIVRRYMPRQIALPCILGIINTVLHVGIFLLCLYLGTTLQEILFIFVVSGTVALFVTRRRKGE